MDDFNKWGCASRCLLKLLEDRGQQMSQSDFLAKFPYPLFKTHPGLLSTALICDVARALQIASDVRAIRGYEAMSEMFNIHGKKVLVQSEINLNQGCLDTIYLSFVPIGMENYVLDSFCFEGHQNHQNPES